MSSIAANSAGSDERTCEDGKVLEESKCLV